MALYTGGRSTCDRCKQTYATGRHDAHLEKCVKWPDWQEINRLWDERPKDCIAITHFCLHTFNDKKQTTIRRVKAALLANGHTEDYFNTLRERCYQQGRKRAAAVTNGRDRAMGPEGKSIIVPGKLGVTTCNRCYIRMFETVEAMPKTLRNDPNPRQFLRVGEVCADCAGQVPAERVGLSDWASNWGKGKMHR